MTPDGLANAEAEIDVWEPMGENPCLPSMPTLNEMAALRKALAQAEHRASLANRDYVAMRLDRDQWKAKYYTSESRRTL